MLCYMQSGEELLLYILGAQLLCVAGACICRTKRNAVGGADQSMSPPLYSLWSCCTMRACTHVYCTCHCLVVPTVPRNSGHQSTFLEIMISSVMIKEGSSLFQASVSSDQSSKLEIWIWMLLNALIIYTE